MNFRLFRKHKQLQTQNMQCAIKPRESRHNRSVPHKIILKTPFTELNQDPKILKCQISIISRFTILINKKNYNYNCMAS